MPRAIGELPTDRAVALGAGTARGADDFACSAAGSFAQQFWSWRPASFCLSWRGNMNVRTRRPGTCSPNVQNTGPRGRVGRGLGRLGCG